MSQYLSRSLLRVPVHPEHSDVERQPGPFIHYLIFTTAGTDPIASSKSESGFSAN